MTDICSIWAYEEIKETGYIGKRQAMVLSVITAAASCGELLHAREIQNRVNRQFNISQSRSLTATRIKELREKGFVHSGGIITDALTRKKVNSWIFTGRRTPKMKTMRRVDCPHCNGCGKVEIEEYLDL